MGKYLVRGVSRLTGEEMDVRVDARDGNEARNAAARSGLVATAVAEIGRGPSKSTVSRSRTGERARFGGK